MSHHVRKSGFQTCMFSSSLERLTELIQESFPCDVKERLFAVLTFWLNNVCRHS